MADEGVRYILQLVGDRQQLDCAEHGKIGDWPAEDDWNPGTADAIETAIRHHQADEHQQPVSGGTDGD